MQRRWLRHAVALAVLALPLGHVLHFYRIDFIERLDALLYDTRLRLTAPGGVDERIAIVDIDQRALALHGRWPWGRDRLAELVSRIFVDQGATVLGIDMVLAEADASSGLPVLEELAAGALREDAGFRSALNTLRPQLDRDRRFAATLERHAVVLSYVFSGGTGNSGVLPKPLPMALSADAALPRWDSFGGNLPQFQRAAQGAGYNNGTPDFDGLSRRVPLLARHGDGIFEALSLALLRAVTGSGTPQPILAQAGRPLLEGLELATPRGALRIPVDDRGMALIPFRGPQGSFAYHSAADVLAGELPDGALRGKIVLLGTTAPGLLDLRATPLGATFPGVEVHANLVAGMLDGRLKAQPAYLPGVEAVVLLTLGLILVFALRRANPVRASLMTVGALLTLGVLDRGLWHGAGLAASVAAPLLLVFVLYGWHMAFGYFVEARARRDIVKLFGQYVPPELVDRMSRNPERYTMDGRSAELTVLFADIRGFTTVSEGMPAADVARMMNMFLTAMTQVIREHRGTLDKYIGDAIMAFWGAPVDDPDHARHALAAACAMQSALKNLNSALATQGWPRIGIGIGLNTGAMTVGDLGSHHRKAYTVIGDAVNLGARLEGLTGHYGVGILVGEALRRAVPEHVYRELDRVQVKGRAKAVSIFEPTGAPAEITDSQRAELAVWNEALSRYRAQDWDGADAVLQRLTLAHPDARLYTTYRDRIALLRQRPPGSEWDGVWRFDSK